MTQLSLRKSITDKNIIAVIRLSERNLLRPVCNALVDGGIKFLEITMTTPDAVSGIKEMNKVFPSNVYVGAGTVTTNRQAKSVIEAGAEFVVSPGLDEGIITECISQKVLVIPGCLTPTEIMQAKKMGVELFKIFPASSFGPKYIKDLKGPFPQEKLIPTGGVNLKNLNDWFEAGASSVGVGSSLIPEELIMNKDFQSISQNAHNFSTNL